MEPPVAASEAINSQAVSAALHSFASDHVFGLRYGDSGCLEDE